MLFVSRPHLRYDIDLAFRVAQKTIAFHLDCARNLAEGHGTWGDLQAKKPLPKSGPLTLLTETRPHAIQESGTVRIAFLGETGSPSR